MSNNKSIELSNRKLCKRCILRLENIYYEITNIDDYNVDSGYDNIIIESSECSSCKGLIDKALEIVERLVWKLEQIEFSTFLVGSIFPKKIKNIDSIFEKSDRKVGSLKTIIAYEIRNQIETKLDKIHDQELPEVTILINLMKKPRFELDIRSLYIFGKYNKFLRGIPQTKWPCTHCKGRGNGCKECSFTGQQYPQSVESVVSKPFLVATKAKSSSFHGAGREDIDALMLGDGRPFVLELKNPYLRDFDLNKAWQEVNQSDDVKIHYVQSCQKDLIKLIKNSSPDTRKSYRAIVIMDEVPTNTQLEALNRIEFPLLINQRTPIRVSHRRADLVRKKTIYSVTILETKGNEMTLDIEAQGGAYIKEFISGDEARSVPSVSSIININSKCQELDVLDVSDKELIDLVSFNNY